MHICSARPANLPRKQSRTKSFPSLCLPIHWCVDWGTRFDQNEIIRRKTCCIIPVCSFVLCCIVSYLPIQAYSVAAAATTAVCLLFFLPSLAPLTVNVHFHISHYPNSNFYACAEFSCRNNTHSHVRIFTPKNTHTCIIATTTHSHAHLATRASVKRGSKSVSIKWYADKSTDVRLIQWVCSMMCIHGPYICTVHA